MRNLDRNEPLARRQPRQARSVFLVDAIVMAAVRVLASKGYGATTTREVAERAGVSVGSLYQYFSDKKSLALAALRREAESVRPRFVDPGSAPEAKGRFRRRLETLMRRAVYMRNTRLPVARQLSAEAPHLLLGDAAVDRKRRAFALLLEADLVRHAGLLRRPDPRLSALVLHRVFEALLKPPTPDTPDPAWLDKARYADEVIDLMSRYLFEDDVAPDPPSADA